MIKYDKPYNNIIDIVAAHSKPSMAWDKKEPVQQWQERARKKLTELIGLNKMVPTEKDVIIEFDEKHDDFREIRFKFQSEPGYYVPCHLLIPNGTTCPKTTFICLQGHSKGMHISLGRTKYEGEAISGDRDFAIRTVREGFCAIALEQRYMGETSTNSDGAPSCEYPTLTNLLIGRTTIAERVWDVMRCIDTIESTFAEFCDVKDIYVMGNSGGGTCSVYAGALETRLKGAVPSCAVSTYSASIGAMPHCACNYIPNIANFFDMGEVLALTAPRDLVVVSGEKDRIFPIEPAKKVFAVAKEAYKAYGIEDHCAHVIGPEGHRFYADITWPVIHKMRNK